MCRGSFFGTHVPSLNMEGNHVFEDGYYKKRGLWYIKIRLGSDGFDVDLATYSCSGRSGWIAWTS